MRNNGLPNVWLAVAALVTGCYASYATVEDTGRDAVPGDDAGAEDGTDAGADDAFDAPPGDADAEAEAEADAVVECPPLMDGTWLSFEIGTGGTVEAIDVDTPCRLGVVIGGPPGHDVVELECGTGGEMTTYTFDFFANPRVYLSFWDGAEVTLRLVVDPVWWVDRWFTVRGRAGNLLFAGVSASHIAPSGEDPVDWYAPLGVRPVGGLCPTETGTCGPEERQALEVTYGGESGLVFDGYTGYVGSMITADVHVGAATNYLEMRCDDVPDSWYTAVFVLSPEG